MHLERVLREAEPLEMRGGAAELFREGDELVPGEAEGDEPGEGNSRGETTKAIVGEVDALQASPAPDFLTS